MAALSTAFPRASRLTAGSDFSQVFRSADRSSDRFFTVLARLNAMSRPRLGLAVSRRVAPRAVDRNRLRRLARESFRHHRLAPLDFVVLAKAPAVTAANPTIRDSLDRHFVQLSDRASRT